MSLRASRTTLVAPAATRGLSRRAPRGVAAPPRSAPAASEEWWTAHGELFQDVPSATALETLLQTTPPSRLVAIEWLAPTCKELLAVVAGELSESVTFARVACATPEARALSKAADVRAFPLLSLHRGGAKLLDFTPSQRGGPLTAAARLRELLETVAGETRPDVHFTMMAGSVHVVEGPPAEEPKKFDYAAMRAQAAAQLKAEAAAAEAAGEAEEGECDSTEEDEECAVKW